MKIIFVIALMTAAAAPLAEDSGLSLTNDPFRKPVLEELIEVELPDELVLIESDPKQIPELRAILRSPRETLVNLNGKLVTIGSKFERFTVAAVGERTAVLVDGNERHVVSIDDEREASDVARYR